MGNAADPDALAARPARRCRTQVGKHLGVNGDHVAAIEYDRAKVRDVLGLPGYGQFYKGKPITTMTYDFWVGRRGHRYDGTRFTLQEIFLSPLDATSSTTTAASRDGDPSWWGLQKKQVDLDLEQPHRDPGDGRGHQRRRRSSRAPPDGGGARAARTPGPVGVGLFTYTLSEQSIARARGGQRGDASRSSSAAALGRFMKLTETPGAYAAHPLGGCRMADSTRPRRRRPPRRGVRLRGPLLHRLLGRSRLARRQPVADDLGRLRARRRRSSCARAADFGLPKPPEGLSGSGTAAASTSAPRRRTRSAQAGTAAACRAPCYRCAVADGRRPTLLEVPGRIGAQPWRESAR